MTTSGFHALTLVEKTREFDQVFSLRFRPSEPISFAPGQYVHLLAPSSPPGRENVRHLSIASLPEEATLRFTVDLSPTSDYKRKLAALEPGGTAHLFKVKGAFVLGDPPPSRAVFLAGGIGITPVNPLLHQIVEHGLAVNWRLAHVARGPFLYQEELSSLGGTQVRIRRREVELLVDQWVRDFPGARWYVSGSARFVNGMVWLLRTRGVEDNNLRVEDFE
jgi:ferredoxin-NADP reductase